MTAHVFIVGDQTFPLHLQYKFAGIGAKDNTYIDFNNSPFTKLYHSTERKLVGMIADISRIRKGDRVLFYLQNSNGNEGRFYGIFRVSEDTTFLDNDNDNQFLLKELKKSLTFRVLIEPEEVYPDGITEWVALDEIHELEKPHQMLWSLIYRKLKANRGCTMITPYEEQHLCDLIRKNQSPLICENRLLNFDTVSRKIIVSNKDSRVYSGTKTKFSLMPRINEKIKRNLQFEVHLQAQITHEIGRTNDSLTNILLGQNEITWLGNEVGCGVGMQSIDVMIAYENQCHHIMPIELKATYPEESHLRQIKRYVDWVEQYYTPNHPTIIIEPVLIAMKHGNISHSFKEAVNVFNREIASKTCKKFRLITFEVCDEKFLYEEINI